MFLTAKHQKLSQSGRLAESLVLRRQIILWESGSAARVLRKSEYDRRVISWEALILGSSVKKGSKIMRPYRNIPDYVLTLLPRSLLSKLLIHQWSYSCRLKLMTPQNHLVITAPSSQEQTTGTINFMFRKSKWLSDAGKNCSLMTKPSNYSRIGS